MKTHICIKRWGGLALLALSLALAGTVYANGSDDANDGHDSGKPNQCHAQLPEAKKKLLHDAMKTFFEKDKPLFEQMHALHKKLHDVLVADAFDKDAYLSLKAEIEKTHAAIATDKAIAFASVAGQFTPEEREILSHRQHRHHHHRHHHKHHGWLYRQIWGGKGEGHDWHHEEGMRSQPDGQNPVNGNQSSQPGDKTDQPVQ